AGLQVCSLVSLRDRSPRRSDFYPKAQTHEWLSKKCKVKPSFSFEHYSSNSRPTCAGCWPSRRAKNKESSHEKVLAQAPGDPYRAQPFMRGRMIQPYDLLTAFDLNSLMLFFWFTLLFDLPRYILSAIAMACVPWQSRPPKRYSTSAIVAGHNEAKSIRQCVCSLEVDEIIVFHDCSTDDMWLEVGRLKQEAITPPAIRLPSRQSNPAAINTGLALCSGEIVLIIDADTVLAPGAVAAVLGYFSDPKVGGVNFNLQVRN